MTECRLYAAGSVSYRLNLSTDDRIQTENFSLPPGFSGPSKQMEIAAAHGAFAEKGVTVT